ncbi:MULTISPECIES: MBL fold metallo-hydrolase [Salinibaculum]|uniref:MBL fold metallo-hydrolase n=1 Tax=Salinibaculum TaxID=2732368 RepID=UPI0030CE0D81
MSEDSYPDPPTDVPAVDPATLQSWLDAGEPVRLLDVRDRDELDQWRIEGDSVTATHIPYAKFMAAKVRDTVADLGADVDGDGPMTVVCGRGEASDFVAGLLTEAGFDARNLAGGMDAWGQLYQATELSTDGATVVQYRRPSSGCLAYMVVDGDEAVVVDPLAAFTDRYVADAEERGAEVVAVVDTHVHADHVSGLRALSEATGARRVLPEAAVERGVTFDAETIADGDEIPVGGTAIQVRALPGHTTGMAGLVVGGVLLSGDSLFLDSVARPDLQDGTDIESLARDLYASLTERLADLPDGTVLAPGHYDDGDERAGDGSYTALLGDVRERVGVFGMDEQRFVDRVTGELPPQPANAERIVPINLGQETVEDDEALELELGPNNCAAGPVEAD